jgi:integration host factor subunit beta
MSDNATKLDLCNRISKKLDNKPVNDIKITVEAFLDEILKILSEGQRIEIRGFGAFCVKNRRPRVGRNPRTGKVIEIPEYKVPHFKFSREAQNNFESKSNKI